MGMKQRTALAMSGLAFAGAAATFTVGAATPADADVTATPPQRPIFDRSDGAGGGAAVGPWGATASGGSAGSPGRIIYDPIRNYDPHFLSR